MTASHETPFFLFFFTKSHICTAKMPRHDPLRSHVSLMRTYVGVTNQSPITHSFDHFFFLCIYYIPSISGNRCFRLDGGGERDWGRWVGGDQLRFGFWGGGPKGVVLRKNYIGPGFCSGAI